jgi:hypothetical protein
VPFAQRFFFWVGFIGFKGLWNPPKKKKNTHERKPEVPDGIIKLTQLEIGHISPKGEGKYFHSFSKTGWGYKLESKFWAGLQSQYHWLKFSPFAQGFRILWCVGHKVKMMDEVSGCYVNWFQVCWKKWWMKLVDVRWIGFKFVKKKWWMKLVDAMRIGFKFVKRNYGWS